MRKRCKIVSGMSLFFWIREKKKKKNYLVVSIGKILKSR